MRIILIISKIYIFFVLNINNIDNRALGFPIQILSQERNVETCNTSNTRVEAIRPSLSSRLSSERSRWEADNCALSSKRAKLERDRSKAAPIRSKLLLISPDSELSSWRITGAKHLGPPSPSRISINTFRNSVPARGRERERERIGDPAAMTDRPGRSPPSTSI